MGAFLRQHSENSSGSSRDGGGGVESLAAGMHGHLSDQKEQGDRIAFWGGIGTQEILPYGSVEQVREETKKVAKALSVKGGYITAPSQEVQKDVPFENLCALIETTKELAGRR